MTSLKQIVKISWAPLLMAGVVAVQVALIVAPVAANALDCAVLPDSLCATAETKSGGDVSNTAIFGLLTMVLNIMAAGVGIVAVGAIIFAGILYTSAGDNQNQVSQAKDIIKNTAIGIIAFAVMYLGLNWLIPGGVFK